MLSLLLTCCICWLSLELASTKDQVSGEIASEIRWHIHPVRTTPPVRPPLGTPGFNEALSRLPTHTPTHPHTVTHPLIKQAEEHASNHHTPVTLRIRSIFCHLTLGGSAETVRVPGVPQRCWLTHQLADVAPGNGLELGQMGGGANVGDGPPSASVPASHICFGAGEALRN